LEQTNIIVIEHTHYTMQAVCYYSQAYNNLLPIV